MYEEITGKSVNRRSFLRGSAVFGAALGTATGWTVVGTHGRDKFAMLPVRVRGGVAVIFSNY